MSTHRLGLVLACFLPAGGCFGADVYRARDTLFADLGRVESAAGDSRLPEPDLAGALDLQKLIELARRRSPDARAALARARAAAEAIPGATALPDLHVGLEHWAVPLDRPLQFDAANTNMFAVRQEFTPPPILQARGEAAIARGREALLHHEAALRALDAEVAAAYWGYGLARRQLEIHRDHQRILGDVARAAQARYAAGRGTQHAVLQVQLEEVGIHADLFASERDVRRARARLNALLARDPTAELGPPEDPALPPAPLDDAELRRSAFARSPELRAAAAAVAAAEAARRESDWAWWLPTPELSIAYWQMPRQDDAWGGSLMFNLPWLSPARWAGVREADARLVEARETQHAAQRRIESALETVLAGAHAARATALLYDTELLPRARQALESVRAAYATERADYLAVLEAERSLRTAELGHAMALAEHRVARAAALSAAGVAAGAPTGEGGR